MEQAAERMRVLIVEDEQELARSIANYIEFNPEFSELEVIIAKGIEEARRIIEDERPLIVLQDINLPDGNGLQLIQQVKKVFPVVQFIVITGASHLDRVLDALAHGASDYLKKPVELATLGRILSHTKERCERWGDLLWQEYEAAVSEEAE